MIKNYPFKADKNMNDFSRYFFTYTGDFIYKKAYPQADRRIKQAEKITLKNHKKDTFTKFTI